MYPFRPERWRNIDPDVLVAQIKLRLQDPKYTTARQLIDAAREACYEMKKGGKKNGSQKRNDSGNQARKVLS